MVPVDAEGQRQRIRAARMKGQKPQREQGSVAEAPACNCPRPSCEGNATVELMTVRLAELVNARMGTYRLVLCLRSRRA
jgi:hypothetical protein